MDNQKPMMKSKIPIKLKLTAKKCELTVPSEVVKSISTNYPKTAVTNTVKMLDVGTKQAPTLGKSYVKHKAKIAEKIIERGQATSNLENKCSLKTAKSGLVKTVTKPVIVSKDRLKRVTMIEKNNPVAQTGIQKPVAASSKNCKNVISVKMNLNRETIKAENYGTVNKIQDFNLNKIAGATFQAEPEFVADERYRQDILAGRGLTQSALRPSKLSNMMERLSEIKQLYSDNVETAAKNSAESPLKDEIEFLADEKYRQQILSGGNLTPSVSRLSKCSNMMERLSLIQSLHSDNVRGTVLKSVENLKVPYASILKVDSPATAWKSHILTPNERFLGLAADCRLSQSEGRFKPKDKTHKKVTFKLPSSGSTDTQNADIKQNNAKSAIDEDLHATCGRILQNKFISSNLAKVLQNVQSLSGKTPIATDNEVIKNYLHPIVENQVPLKLCFTEPKKKLLYENYEENKAADEEIMSLSVKREMKTDDKSNLSPIKTLNSKCTIMPDRDQINKMHITKGDNILKNNNIPDIKISPDAVSENASENVNVRESLAGLRNIWGQSSIIGELRESFYMSDKDKNHFFSERDKQFSLSKKLQPHLQVSTEPKNRCFTNPNIYPRNSAISKLDRNTFLSLRKNSILKRNELIELQRMEEFAKRNSLNPEEAYSINRHSNANRLSSYRESIYSGILNSNCINPSEKNLPKLCRPRPISLHNQMTINQNVSPEFMSEQPSNIISHPPIQTPLVLKTLAKRESSPETSESIYSSSESSGFIESSIVSTPDELRTFPIYFEKRLSCVCKKLDFSVNQNEMENSNEGCQELPLQTIVTQRETEEYLADQECNVLSSYFEHPVTCYRNRLINPIALTLDEGDEMHFVPVDSHYLPLRLNLVQLK